MTSVENPPSTLKTPRRKNPHPDANAIQRQVLLGLAGLRSGGFHFPSYFLNIDWSDVGESHIGGTMAIGPQCRNADGSLNLAAFSVLLDTAVAIGSRLKLPAGSRQATVQLHAQFTGRPLRGLLSATATHEGHTPGPGVRQAILRASVFADGEAVCHATSAFANLPVASGVSHGPPVRERKRLADVEPLKVEQLDAAERRVLQACDNALKRADARHGFIEHFWNMLPRPAPGGARCDVPLGTQFGNRTGAVQGGLLFGIAAATAQVAVPHHRHISNVSAWFVGPGRGKRLTVRSHVIHAGRSFAVVRTEIKSVEGVRVLETVSQHAA